MTNATRALFLVAAAAPLSFAAWLPAKQPDGLEKEFASKVKPIIKAHCLACHSGTKPSGGLSLDKPISIKDVTEQRSKWGRLIFNVKSRSMPPDGGMTDTDRATIVNWFEKALGSDCKFADAGKVTLRRLNRLQYQNTVHDLLGIDIDLTKDFPSDDVGEGFDNIGDVLTTSPLLLEKYLSAAEKATQAAIRIPSALNLEVDLIGANLSGGVNLTNEGELGFFSSGTASKAIKIPDAGHYTLTFRAWAQQAGPEPAKAKVTWDQKTLDIVPIKAVQSKIVEYEIPLDAKAGQHTLSFSFANDYYDPQNPDPQKRDRNLYVISASLSRPAIRVPLPNGPITVMPTSDSDLAAPTKVVSDFATKAYRRPVEKQETDRLLKIYQAVRSKGEGYESAVQTCLSAVLTSPHFLFRVENPIGKNGDRPLNDFELATRLSYFLWGTMPDSSLSSLAVQKGLTDRKALETQAERMLNSSKARNLGSDFALQWLQLRRIESCSPDPKMFPEYNESLRSDMLMEVESMFMDAVYQDKSVLTLVDSDKTFLNERLAKLYSVPGVSGANFREVTVADPNRGGLFGTAAFLTVTSNPNRTSPVKRGKWILEQILGTPPPSPPPNVPILPQDTAIKPTLPMKERLAQHRKDPSCANCHRAMDALGFSLEHLDPIGRYRDKDGDMPIDSKGELPDGKSVSGVDDLKKLVMGRKSDFVRCLAEKLLTYAIGRGLRPEDSCHVDKIVKTTENSGYKFHALIKAIVTSDPFCKASPQPVVH